jgi:nucleoside-triphosphatase
MEHIFLTGPIQCGKTTLIQRVLGELGNIQIGGFRTISVPTAIPGAMNEVYIVPAIKDHPKLTRDNLIGIRWGDRRYSAYPEAFETSGVGLLQNDANAQIILMDELGIMENKAPYFISAVETALNGDIPILGVIKPQHGLLADTVRRHPRARVIAVDVKNRDRLVPEITELLRRQF